MDFETEKYNVGPGWQPLIEKLNRDLLALDPDYRIDQIKEKFGGLRYYWTASEDLPDDPWLAMDHLVADAERLSETTCESCGAPGELRGAGWLVTQCDACWATRPGATT